MKRHIHNVMYRKPLLIRVLQRYRTNRMYIYTKRDLPKKKKEKKKLAYTIMESEKSQNLQSAVNQRVDDIV